MTPPTDHLLPLVANIVSAHVSHNAVGTQQLPAMIRAVHATLREMDAAAPAPRATEAPRRQVGKPTPDILTCLECGMRMKMLKRHLLTVHNLTPDAYRRKHNLAPDAPMVTSNYAELRSKLAKASGLGKRNVGATGKPRR